MTEIYMNSKGEEVKISEMATTHLLYTIAKSSRVIGTLGTADAIEFERKSDEVKAMHGEVMRRFTELSEELKGYKGE